MSTIGTNSVILVGTIASDIKTSNCYVDEDGRFMRRTYINVARLSGNVDKIPIVLEAMALEEANFIPEKGDRVYVEGFINTKIVKGANGEKHYLKTMFVNSISMVDDTTEDRNEVHLSGKLCKDAIFRTTPAGRLITELEIDCRINEDKTMRCIPCIAWGGNAIFSSEMQYGEEIEILGRLQSRKYRKILPDGKRRQKTAYEVSVIELF